MPHYKYLIIGGGMTADSATQGIREIDPAGTIGMVSAEQNLPYDRPPLSKKLWKHKKFETIWRRPEERGVEMHLGRTITRLNPHEKSATDDQGSLYSYDKLLLATGGTSHRLPFEDEGRVIYFRTVGDYLRLRDLAEKGERFAVIGGGFIGSEIAAALAMNGKRVSFIAAGEGIGHDLYPYDLVQFLNEYYREKGVEVVVRERAAAVQAKGDATVVRTDRGREMRVDGVVAGIGIQPNIGLARCAGLRVGDGIVVDEHLRTSHSDIYAAGDVASFYDPALGKRRRVEHEDNANTMGRAAGRAMAGAPEVYNHLPFFYSDLFDLGYEAVGELDPRLQVVADWKDPYKEGVLYYLSDGRVRGVLLWNVWDQVDAARRLIAEPGPFKAEDLKGRLPEA